MTKEGKLGYENEQALAKRQKRGQKKRLKVVLIVE